MGLGEALKFLIELRQLVTVKRLDKHGIIKFKINIYPTLPSLAKKKYEQMLV